MNSVEKHIALEVNNLSIGYTTKKKAITIAQGIDFSIPEGQLTAIVGVNGIGKSTLLRTLAKVQPLISGNIQVNGRSLEEFNSTQLAARLSVVLTEPIASKNLTVRELISLGRQPYTNWIGTLSEKDSDKIKEAIELVGLESLQHKKCYELSDGQLQKVMIARAIAQDTGIILLDEPTTHLDLYHKVQILKLLQGIAHKTNKTVLYTTHEIDMAIQLCDTILILDNNTNPFANPESLIEQKSFENLFPSHTVQFDAKTGSFKIRD